MTTNLIIGGTGKTGRRVASLLQGRGLPVTSLSRPEFDWADPTTWSSVERPAASAYLTFAPDLTFPGAPEAVAEVAERMARSGVRRIVLLSGRGEAEAQRAEQLVADVATKHGATWGVVRCAFFMQNFDESLFAEPLAAGHLAFSAGAVREPFVDLDDVAEVAVAMMTDEAASNRVYELTGPRLMTFAEATAEIATATGREIGYEQITNEQLVADLIHVGLPAEEAGGLGELFAHILDGHNEHLADGVREALGRPARAFAEYARRAARSGAWPQAAAS
ncbi:NmrA family transcriptional regulator [Nocardioides sp. WS12]|uniref:NmrA family transcriptional regulator n=1 Tax=Nocardioides sp. WS12 TaxID=2486272 RepID=UPI00191CD53F|nr:NmrA family transcriptional regulator [Nocardioides sp. WS12]